MKKIILIILFIIALIATYFVVVNITEKKVDMKGKKVLVVYYSYSGNTRAFAEKIHKYTGGDIAEIKPKKPYPTDYNTLLQYAKQERYSKAKPEIEDLPDVRKYDLIFVGSPIWWDLIAGPVRTFLSENNFEGKTIAPFSTYSGGDLNYFIDDMKKNAPKATFKYGYSIYEKNMKESNIQIWIKQVLWEEKK